MYAALRSNQQPAYVQVRVRIARTQNQTQALRTRLQHDQPP